MLSSLRSFKDSQTSNTIQHGHSTSFIEAVVLSPLGRQRMVWGYHKERGRALQLDGKKIQDLTIWFQSLRSILFCPEQIDIVRGSPQVRRQFMDRARFIADPLYLNVVRNYLRVLKQKRELLKKESLEVAELLPWNLQIINYGKQIIEGRHRILRDLYTPFKTMHRSIAGNDDVDLFIQGIGSGELQSALDRFETELTNAIDEEVRKRQVLIGPHRDDLGISLNGLDARRFASQGQTRSIIVSLKLAELEASRLRGEKPLFLLDDLSSELDLERRRRLVNVLAEREGQVWITTTQPNFLSDLPRGRIARFYVENGTVTPE